MLLNFERLGVVALVIAFSVRGDGAWAQAKMISIGDDNPLAEVLEDGPIGQVLETDCTPERPSAEARVIGFWAPGATEYRTDVTMYREDGPTHESTWSIKVVIEEGVEPLYIGLTSEHSVIWNFEGAIDRIERVILNGTSEGQGTEGLSVEKVGFMDMSCHVGEPWQAHFLASPNRSDYPGVFGSATGRTVEIVQVTGPIDVVRLPSGATQRGERRGPGYNPLRFHEVDVASLVTSRLVDRPEILPGMAGVQQLVARGDLVQIPGDPNGYTVVSQLDWLPNAPVGYMLGEGITPPSKQVYPACLLDSAGNRVSFGNCYSEVFDPRKRPPGPRQFVD